MIIVLTKNSKVGDTLCLKGWEGEVERTLGESIIRNGRAVEKSPNPKKKVARKVPTQKDDE